MTDPDLVARAFRRAIDLARAQEGATAPNPSVGCVLLDAQGAELAAAAHLGAGLPHAEVEALALAPHPHTAVVTLEPCKHHGRTGPCSQALIRAGVAEVWYAMGDPNALASGGARALAAAGVQVFGLADLPHPDTPRLLDEARRLLAPFASRVSRGRPFVTVKQALDAAGGMIPPAGQKTFTSAESLRLAHRLRRRADAILTGSGTVLADRPEFTVRHLPDIPGKARFLCILDRRGRVDEAYLNAARARGFHPLIATDPLTALQTLAAQGCNEALLEAGPTLTEAFRAAGLWDEWVTIRQGDPDTVTISHP